MADVKGVRNAPDTFSFQQAYCWNVASALDRNLVLKSLEPVRPSLNLALQSLGSVLQTLNLALKSLEKSKNREKDCG